MIAQIDQRDAQNGTSPLFGPNRPGRFGTIAAGWSGVNYDIGVGVGPVADNGAKTDRTVTGNWGYSAVYGRVNRAGSGVDGSGGYVDCVERADDPLRYRQAEQDPTNRGPAFNERGVGFGRDDQSGKPAGI